LGRVCDRPCEPACRRGRIEEKPVAICRLKRVASDNRDDITALLPKRRARKTATRRLYRRGPASLTVANDLLPLATKSSYRAIRRTRRLDAHQYPHFASPPKSWTRKSLHREHGRDLRLIAGA